MEKGSWARRVMRESFEKMGLGHKLDKILKEMPELGSNHFDYMNIPRGLSEVPSHLKVGSVEKLPFGGLRLTPIDCAVLSYVIGFCDTITELDLESGTILCEGLQRLGPVLHKCRVLRLSHNNLGDSGVKPLSAALRNPDCNIQKLGLWFVGLTDSCAEDLASALSTNRSLTDLNLSENELGDSGVKLVSAALRNLDCKIQKLGLRAVGLTDSCAEDLASALSTIRSLTDLDLRSNFFTDRSVPALSRLTLTCRSLELIQLRDNRFSSDGAKQLELLRGTRPGLTVTVY